MQSRAARLACSAVALLAIGGAAAFLTISERRLTERQSAFRTFDRRAREAIDALAELRAAEQAYVAAGQGVAYWMPRVGNLVESLTQAVDALHSMATSEPAVSALEEAAEAVHALSGVDQRARDYVKSGQQLMAGDVVFTEGRRTVETASRAIDAACEAEMQAADANAANWRRREAAALSAAAAYTILALVLLIRTPRAAASLTAPEDRAEEGAAIEPPRASTVQTGSGAGEDLPLREAESRPAQAPAPLPPAQVLPARVESPLLRTAAKVCTDFARVTSSDDMNELLGQIAQAIDASGVVVWLAHPAGGDLQPVLAHGYSPQALARIPSVPRSADNAAAAAYRSGTMQIVLARPGTSRGALVAPLVSADGCIGALSAEIADGGETSDSVQALAAIFAAQLAVALVSPAQPSETRTAASG